MIALHGLSAVKLALVAEQLRPEAQAAAREPIAIVGFDCRFPGGEDPDAFWALLAEGRSAVGPVPPDRWDAVALYDADHSTPGTIASLRGAFLSDVAGFDAALFGIAAREAASLDPQQRLLLEVAWQALERAAIAPDRLAGTATGIFVGMASADYAARILATGDRSLLDGHYGSGNAPAFAAGRLAYQLGTVGPAVTVDATCASSLVALHQACAALHAGECDMAIAGGVHLSLAPAEKIYLSRAGALAPDGRSKPFAAEADGFGGGEGCAVVLLMRLSRAVREGHAIAGLVRGSAVGHGGASGGLTVPNGAAQARVIRDALAASGLDPADIDACETHGTGTRLGDPIELHALSSVFAASRPDDAPLRLGGVKANVGHAEAAAGLCGVVKLLLALRHETFPGQPPIEAVTGHFDWAASALVLATGNRPWKRMGRPRRAGVSAFGLSGTNAHVVIEEAPALPDPVPSDELPCHLYALSAPDDARLRALAAGAAASIRAAPDVAPAAWCRSANLGRARHAMRTALVIDDRAALLAGLEALAATPQMASPPAALGGIAFMVSGQGSAVPGMGAQLYRDNAAFRAAIDRCGALLAGTLDTPLTTLLFDPGAALLLAQTRHAQPALAAFAWSLAAMWRDFGLTPAALIGHSLGEYVAACLAGMIELEPMLHLVARRGALMQRVAAGGAMLAVQASAEQARPWLDADPAIALAARNAARRCVLSGPAASLQALRAQLEGQGVRGALLPVDGAFHSPMMDPILDELAELARVTGFAVPTAPVIAGLTGDLHAVDAAPAPDYWARQARAPVAFAEGLATLRARGHRLFLELGPRPVLSLLGPLDHADATFLPSLGGAGGDWRTVLEAAAALWCAGVDLDLAAIGRDRRIRRVAQPPLPMRRQRHWFAETKAETKAQPQPASESPAMTDDRAMRLRAELTAQLSTALGEPADSIAPDRAFAELGADSIMLADAARGLSLRYGVAVPLSDLLGRLGNVASLADHIATRIGPVQTPPPEPTTAPADDDVTGLMRRQLDLVETLMREQLAMLGRAGAAPAPKPAALPPPAPEMVPMPPAEASETPQRAAHRTTFIAAYTRRTAQSKTLAEARRPRVADVRAAVGFRPSIKEILYPITGDRADGARLRDVDGNDYIDISMDFGVNLFGHNAPVIRAAMQEQLDRGLALGPRSPLAGEVAALLCELTGMDRVLFTQSGSEAVMTAARLARLIRRRPKIAVFRNSYHGHFDGFLGERVDWDGRSAVRPAAPGILDDFVGQLLVLDYGAEQALDAIAAGADEIAAVLVEPVQSRALHLQPREFLHALRALTEKHGILLIFDEMITGLRVHPGGAQAVFGVQADLATYGKALGGGVPMAALAARGTLLDGIDGGAWRFGDASRPSGDTTFFAGTFNNHPLGLAAARAVLGELRRAGPSLQDGLNATTAAMQDRLNQGFSDAGVPLSVSRFGSVFRFRHSGNLDLLYYHMLHRGLFVWEGRNCFLSTAHQAADIDAIVARTLDSVAALQDGGFMPGRRSFAVSATQRQIWLAAEAAPAGADPYVETLAAELRGRLDTAALQRACDELLRRHDALRATIDADGAHLRIAGSGRLAVQTAPEGGDPDDWTADFARAPFNLTGHAPLRVGLLRLDAERHRLVLVAHHALLDGWSLRLLVQDLTALYAAAVEGAPAPAAPTAQLGDHLARLERLRGDPGADDAYWRDLIAEAPEAVPLDRDGPLPRGGQRRGGRVRLPVPPASLAALQALARDAGVTLFAAACCATAAYLHRLYGRQDLLLGTPASGREPEEAGMAGQAAQLMPVRSRLAAGATLREHVGALAVQLARSAERQSRTELAPILAADPVARAALNVTFNLDRLNQPAAKAGLAVTLLDAPAAGAKFDLCLNLTVAGAESWLDLDHDADAFTPAAMRRLGERWIAWIGRAEEESARPVVDRSVLDVADAGLIAASNATERRFPDPRPIPALIAAQATAAPDRIAVRFGDASLTYGALHAAAAHLATRLASRGVGPDSIVACLLPRSADLVVALLGIALAGGSFLPVDPEDPPERIAGLLADADPRLLVTRGAEAALHPGLAPPLLLLDDAPAAPNGATASLPEVSGENLAYVLFTSGSTGRPKAVLSEHRGLRNRILWMQDRFPLGPDNVVLQKTPATFDVSVWEFFWPLTQGACLVVCPPGLHRDPGGLARLIQAERVTTVHFVPSMLDVFLAHPAARGCRTLTHVFCSGEALDGALRDRFFAAGLPAELHNLYGPTEASIDVTHFMCGAGDRGAVPIGHPVANTTIRLLDTQLRPVAQGVEGDLYIGGVQLARGYLNRAELTEQRFIVVDGERLYATGDRACYRADGAILYRGRADQQRKLRGIRIELGEIEARLREHPAVADAVADVRGDAAAGQRLVAWVVPKAGGFVAPTFVADADGLHRTALPGGLELHCRNPAEARFMIEECFGGQGFDIAGLDLPADACVVDAGANIGVFSLAALAVAPDATVLAFEPIPAVFALLERNAAGTAGRVVGMQCALGESEGDADFTWYPQLSILSGRHADGAADARTVRAFLGHEAGAAVPGAMLGDIAEARLHAERVRCPVTTLSAAIRQHGLRRIDLLKIDVEGDEAAVLAGLEDAHWPLVDRLLIEVAADAEGVPAALEAALTARGYRIAARQAPWASGTGLHLLTAVHRRVGALPPPRAITAAPTAAELRAHLARVLPAAMVPATYQMIAELPLSRHGKLDRAALPDPLAPPAAPPAGQQPRTPTEQALLAHWRETLGLPVGGVDQDFFAAGGESLAAARLTGWAQEQFDTPIRLRDFLAAPTIARLASLIEATRGETPPAAIQPRARPSHPAPLRATT